jgi:hypothetical protein
VTKTVGTAGGAATSGTSTATPSSSATTATAQATTSVGPSGDQPPLPRALSIVRGRDYFPTDTSGYDARASLAVLLGVRKGSADGTAQRAFFFAGGRFIGTDTSDDSAGIRVERARPPVIALGYELFNPKDAQCCPTAGSATVRYRWDGHRLVPLEPVPPSSFSARDSRR